jgi:hypothetical protein
MSPLRGLLTKRLRLSFEPDYFGGFVRFWISFPAVSIAVPVAWAASLAPAAASWAASFASCFISAVAAVSTAGTVADTVVVLLDTVDASFAVVLVSVFWVQPAATINNAVARIVIFMLPPDS